MKSVFAEYYPYTKHQKDLIWNNCKIVLDTNVLLNIYGLNNDNRHKFFELLTKAQDKLIMPYQIGQEFYRNRLNRIDEYLKGHNNVKTSILAELKSLINKIENSNPLPFSFIRHHDSLNQNLVSIFKETIVKVEDSFDSVKDQQLSESIRKVSTDHILEQVDLLFKEKITESYTDSYLEDLYSLGKKDMNMKYHRDTRT